MKIKIYMFSYSEYHNIYLNDQKRDYILVDRQKSSFNVEKFKSSVFDMVANWPNLLEDKSYLDGLEYQIEIKKDGNEQSFKFRNKFPDDIYKLTDLISEICKEFNNGRNKKPTIKSKR